MNELERLVNAYQKTLKPGIYFFSAMMDGSTIADIEETAKKYTIHNDYNRSRVILIYYPAPLPMNDVEKLTPFAEETSEHFQKKLVEFLKKKLGET